MKLMTRSAHSNKIIDIAVVFAVDVSPLNHLGFFTELAALSACSWLSLLSAYPLVKSAIANIFSAPCVVLVARNFLSLFTSPFRISFVAWFEPKWLTMFHKFLYSSFGVASSGAVISFPNLRWGAVSNLFTGGANGLYHVRMIASS